MTAIRQSACLCLCRHFQSSTYRGVECDLPRRTRELETSLVFQSSTYRGVECDYTLLDFAVAYAKRFQSSTYRGVECDPVRQGADLPRRRVLSVLYLSRSGV